MHDDRADRQGGTLVVLALFLFVTPNIRGKGDWHCIEPLIPLALDNSFATGTLTSPRARGHVGLFQDSFEGSRGP